MSRISTDTDKIHLDMPSASTNSHDIPKNYDIHPSYSLYEMDWIQIIDYMDMRHAPLLYPLCLSSYVSPSCMGLKFPWILIMHHLDLDMQRIIANMVHEGTYLLVYIYSDTHVSIYVNMPYRSMVFFIGYID